MAVDKKTRTILRSEQPSKVTRIGRPRVGTADATGNRQTRPLLPGQRLPSRANIGSISVPRRGPFDFSLPELDTKAGDLELLYDWLPLVSPDASLAVWLMVNLADSGWSVSVKNPTEASATAIPARNAVSQEDTEATAMAYRWLERSGSYVHSDIPGACGNENTLVRSLLRDGALKGALSAETVFSEDFSDAEFVTFDPLTVEFRRDELHPGKFTIGQKQSGTKLGWMPLNPNLVTYYTLDGTLYGDSPMAPALYTLPYYAKFFLDAQVFLHNSAWGVKDGEVNTEKLKELWDSLREDERRTFNNDFLTWALDQAAIMGRAIDEAGEDDPDGTKVHLDLMKLKSLESAANGFPLKDYHDFMKGETINGVKTPAALMNGRAGGDKSFNVMQIGAYESFLLALQRGVKYIIERMLRVAFTGIGYDKKIFIDFKFSPVQVSDRLTEAQAEQLEILNILKKRDQNFISQNEASLTLTNTKALGSAPLSEGADPDGASAPSVDVMAQRHKAGQSKSGSASGPSFGGNKKVADTQPAQDNNLK